MTPAQILFRGAVYRLAEATKDVTFENLRRAFPRLSAQDAERIVDDIADAETPGEIDVTMAFVDRILGGMGVEGMRAEGISLGHPYDDTVALYINVGEAEDPTVLYDTQEKSWHIGSHAGFTKAWEAKHAKEADVRTADVGEEVTVDGVLGKFGQWIGEEEAKAVVEAINDPGRPDVILQRVDKLIEGHGVEAVHPLYEDGTPMTDEDPLALYVNTGDLYSSTIAWCADEGEYRLTTLADVREDLEAKGLAYGERQ